MGIFASKKPKSRVTEQDKAVLQLKRQRDVLKQYQKRVELTLEKDKNYAKELVHAGKKEKALLILRKKRFQEQQLSKTDGMLENIEKMTQDIEFAQVEIQVINGLKAGNTALKQLNSILSIDEIEKIMDETKEGVEKQREIDEILHGCLTAEDEDAALEELNEILGASEQMIDDIPELPEVPTGDLTEREEKRVREKTKREMVALEA